MKIAIGADHGGYPIKAQVITLLESLGHQVLDLGAHEYNATDDYPDFARYVGQAIQHQQAQRGIILCGSGVGACIAANKMKGVRACVCHDIYSASQGVEHDDMNVLCLGGRIIGQALIPSLITAFASATFDTDARFVRRLEKVKAIEAAEYKS